MKIHFAFDTLVFNMENQRNIQRLCGFITLGVLITPASTLLTMPVAFIYLSPFLQRTVKPPLCKGRWHGKAVAEGLSIPQSASQPAPFTQGGLFSRLNNFTNYAVSICKGERRIRCGFAFVSLFSLYAAARMRYYFTVQCIAQPLM